MNDIDPNDLIAPYQAAMAQLAAERARLLAEVRRLHEQLNAASRDAE